jgi:uncharacterized protein (TIGR01777 family)
MNIVVSGSSGLIGAALCAALDSRGHSVVRLVRRPASPGESQWDPTSGVIDAKVIDTADAVVNLSGAGIGDRRWTDAYRRELVDSRVKGTALLASAISDSATPPRVFLSGSAIGAYGPTGDEELTEESPLGTTFLADLCRQWEAAARHVPATTRVALLRTGIVLSPKGGALSKQLPLFKLGLGGRFGSGRPWQSWISLPDEVAAIIHLLDSPLDGPVNLTAPQPVRGREFAKVLGTVLRRPALLPVPPFGPKLVLGSELAETLLFTGQRVLPAKLLVDGFEFAHPRLDQALRAVLGRP